MRTALTINLNDDNPLDAELIRRVKQLAIEKNETRSSVLQTLVLLALDMPIPQSNLEARIAILESMIENGVTLGRHDTLTDIVERVMRGRPVEVKAEDFKGDK